jgi:hypothetical protein
VNEARDHRDAASTLGRVVSVSTAVCVVGSIGLGAYTVFAPLPACGGLYLCRRVVDRTLLLGWTALVVATAAAVVLAVTWRGSRIGRPLRVVLLAVGCLLIGAYWRTHFGSLRAGLATQMALAAPMWTATYAFWLAVVGLGFAALGIRSR